MFCQIFFEVDGKCDLISKILFDKFDNIYSWICALKNEESIQLDWFKLNEMVVRVASSVYPLKSTNGRDSISLEWLDQIKWYLHCMMFFWI